MQNPDIARLFDEVADLLEIQDANPFRVRAYRNAARTIRDFPEPIADLVRAGTKDLTDIAGIGDDLAEKITDIVTTGELPLRKQLAGSLLASCFRSGNSPVVTMSVIFSARSSPMPAMSVRSLVPARTRSAIGSGKSRMVRAALR